MDSQQLAAPRLAASSPPWASRARAFQYTQVGSLLRLVAHGVDGLQQRFHSATRPARSAARTFQASMSSVRSASRLTLA